MASVRYGLGITKRQKERVIEAFRRDMQRLPIIPYLFPWYELLLSGKLTIRTPQGDFAVKTGLWPRKHRGWTGFYHSKSRIADMVAARHGIKLHNSDLGVLIGVGYLEDSRVMTFEERYALALRFNAYTERKFRKYWKDIKIDVSELSAEDKIELGVPADWVAMPYPVGNFYRTETLKRFKKPIPIQYPSGAVTGTNFVVTPEILKALQEVGVRL